MLYEQEIIVAWVLSLHTLPAADLFCHITNSSKVSLFEENMETQNGAE